MGKCAIMSIVDCPGLSRFDSAAARCAASSLAVAARPRVSTDMLAAAKGSPAACARKNASVHGPTQGGGWRHIHERQMMRSRSSKSWWQRKGRMGVASTSKKRTCGAEVKLSAHMRCHAIM